MKKERVAVYIDGFNLYFGMVEANYNTKWLNVELLSKNLLQKNQILSKVKYFTARIKNNLNKERRQSIYIDAINSTNTEVIFGKYKSGVINCKKCGNQWPKNEEKMTDVNISVHLLMDAFKDNYDKAIIISGDSDLVPPIKAIKSTYSNLKVGVAFPPKRITNELKQAAHFSLHLSKSSLTKSQFPKETNLNSTFNLRKPSEWF